MTNIDWTDARIIAAIVGGVFALSGVILAALLSRSRGGKSQQAIRSTNVQQIQSERDVHIGDKKDKPNPPQK